MSRQSIFAPRRGLPTARGGLYALAWPVTVTLLALLSIGGSVGDLTDLQSPIIAGVLFLIGAPTTWVFALLDLAPALAVALGVVTSFPLWFLLGSWLAERAWDWLQWWRRYTVCVIGSCVGWIVLFATVASFAG